jgi:transcriptional regulator with XRE-family HTH domain
VPHDPTLKRELSKAVVHLRSQREWSQEELAAKAGLNETYVPGVESGRKALTWATITSLAAAFEMQVSEFVRVAERIEAGELQVPENYRRPRTTKNS